MSWYKTSQLNILYLISTLSKKFNVFGGNCGQFVYGLGKFLKDRGEPNIKIGMITSDVEDKNELSYGEPDIYHVFLNVNGKLYDGSGEINRGYLSQFSKDWYANDEPMFWDDFEINEQTRLIISINTNWDTEWIVFYNYLKNIK
jgi:hypothetical protein